MENKVSVKKIILEEFHVAEAVKALRTNLFFTGAETRVVAITSYTAAEGKSTISLQLAASIAETGKRVVVLDTDMRKSVMHSRLRTRGKTTGLSHYLSGMVNASETIMETDVPNLYILFAGSKVPNPAELLGGEAFVKLVSALRDTFDYVIVDTAPLGRVIDAAVIAPRTDGVIMVVDAMGNNYRQEKRIKQQLERSGARVLGVVLNRVNRKNNPAYYGSKYGYGYGYGYGY